VEHAEQHTTSIGQKLRRRVSDLAPVGARRRDSLRITAGGGDAPQTRKADTKKAEGAEWLRRIEEQNADELTPERIAAMEAEAAKVAEDITAPPKERLSEEASPTAGRRFTRT